MRTEFRGAGLLRGDGPLCGLGVLRNVSLGRCRSRHKAAFERLINRWVAFLDDQCANRHDLNVHRG